MILLFFLGRGWHVGWPRDWSSDVCSSDLTGSPAILLASILIAPVPYFSTQSATVSLRPVSASISGFLTTMIGSWAGLSAVPHPSHLRASSVAGAVISNVFVVVFPLL